MKKLVLALGVIVAISTMSCINEGHQVNESDQVDSTTVESVPEVKEVTGIAIDGAMNSVYLKVGDDTIEFSYPDLDTDHRASWEINDTLTVQYFSTENGDSVTSIINENA